jgi:carbon-monoxide dehydrogenase large subunit
MRVGGEAIMRSVRQLIDAAGKLAAQMLQANIEELQFTLGEFVIRNSNSDRRVSLFEVAAFSENNDTPLSADTGFEQQRESYSSGCHICEVTIDSETGKVSLLQHVLVTDVGTAINPMIVHGQVTVVRRRASARRRWKMCYTTRKVARR